MMMISVGILLVVVLTIRILD